jgi:type II secretory ATPase GspE/PulE/Tfp pilus assembly ATPase PilB-like protein
MDDAMREAVLAKADAATLRRVMAGQGCAGLAADAARHIRAGRTTTDEVGRVLGVAPTAATTEPKR